MNLPQGLENILFLLHGPLKHVVKLFEMIFSLSNVVMSY